MSRNRLIFIGHYLRVWMPKEKRSSMLGTCPNCGNVNKSAFCPKCGSKLIFKEVEYLPRIYDYCKKVFGDEDRFRNPNIEDEKDYIIVLKNRQDALGCLEVDDYETEQELPDKNKYSEDWQTLMDALNQDGIKHERRFGIVNYYS